MDKEWVERKNKEYKENYEKIKTYAIKEIKNADFIKDKKKEKIINLIKEERSK